MDEEVSIAMKVELLLRQT